MNSNKEKNILVYNAAYKYLEEMTPEGIDLEKYFKGDSRDYKSLKDIYIQIIKSAQNYRSMPNAIAFDKRKEKIAEILYDFDYYRIKDLTVEDLYYTFRKEFEVTSADTKWNSWYKWSYSVVDAAKFMVNFSDVKDFETFVGRFDYNVATRMALPLFIEAKISGIGFVLACDLLKELGFTNYPKPDVHMIEVFSGIGLSDEEPDIVFAAITRMANDVHTVDSSVTPYKVDKVFWLICSGRYYLEEPEEVRVKSKKQELIEHLKEVCKSIEDK